MADVFSLEAQQEDKHEFLQGRIVPRFVAQTGLAARYRTLEAITNPAAVVEVLSPTTEARDRGLKKEAYALISSIREIVLVDASKPHVELPFAEIYDGVDFSEPIESPPLDL